MPAITLDKIIFRNNDSYKKMYKGSELIAQVDSGGGYDYLTFTALTAGSTVNFNRPNVTTCSYSIDNGTTWNNGDNVTVTLTNIGDKVMYKGVTSAQATSYSDTTVVFTMTGGIKASGSLMSMHNGNPNDTSITYNYEFCAFFNNCSALTDITDLKLPATTLTLFCYNRLFKNTGITSVPSGFLPATTVLEGSYSRMFYYCTSLTTVPSNLLPATNFQGTNCYNNMFYGCSNLTTAPSLPATTLVNGCYSYMFRNCSALTSIPDLPSKEIMNQCYYYMFDGCTGLTGTVKVPFESINSSYNNACGYMFSGCSGITGAEVGTNAGYTSSGAFNNMFRQCRLLSSIKCLANYRSRISYSNWVTEVASSGTFIKATGQGWSSGNSGIPTGWTVTEQSPVVPVPEVKGYVTLTNNGNTNTSIKVENFNSSQYGRLVYSTDGTTWNWLTDTAVTILPNNSVYIAGDKACSDSSTVSYNKLSITGGSVSASGNVRYLYECSSEIPGTMPSSALISRFYGCTGITDISGLVFPNVTSNRCYYQMFYKCTGITTVPSNLLPATTLSNYCYCVMFHGCTSLTTIPSDLLPATTLTSRCYEGMFYGCTSLTTAPSLPATTLADSCYSYMFYGCTSLTTPPDLPATTLATNCYQYMFSGSGVTKTKNSSNTTIFHATTLANYCYQYMFYNCTSLTTFTSPYISGIVSPTSSNRYQYVCYHMFDGCTGLTTVDNISTSYLSGSYNYFNSNNSYMFANCTNLATAYRVPNPKGSSDNSYMFYNCTSLTRATYDTSGGANGFSGIFSSCLAYMFAGCTSLVDASNITINTISYTYGINVCDHMFYGCTSLTQLPKIIFNGSSASITWNADTSGYCTHMFEGCTSLTKAVLPKPYNGNNGSYGVEFYSYMYAGCTNITQIEGLDASMYGNQMYYHTFEGCASLTSVEIPHTATISNTSCFDSTFYNCSSLSQVTTHFTTFPSSYTTNWLYGVAATGDFYNLGEATIPSGASGIPSGWTEHTPTPSTPVPTSVSIFNQFEDGTTPSTVYGTLTENTNDWTFTWNSNQWSDVWSGVDIVLPYDCSSFTYHILSSFSSGAVSNGSNVRYQVFNQSGRSVVSATNIMTAGATSYDSDFNVSRPASIASGDSWKIRTYMRRTGDNQTGSITITIPKSTI